MLKQAWRSYVASLHPRYLRKAYDEGRLFWLFYWAFIYPVIMQGLTGQEEYYDIGFVVMIRLLPFGIMMWSDISSKYLMPKAMFLSPMKEEERREYVNHVIFIKIGMTVLYSVCGEVIMNACYGFHIWESLLIVFVNFSLALATYISVDALGKVDSSTKIYRINDVVKICSGLVIIIIAALTLGTSEAVVYFFKIAIAITIIGIIIMDIIIISSEYKATIALTGDYELAYRTPAKEEKPVKFDLFPKKE